MAVGLEAGVDDDRVLLLPLFRLTGLSMVAGCSSTGCGLLMYLPFSFVESSEAGLPFFVGFCLLPLFLFILAPPIGEAVSVQLSSVLGLEELRRFLCPPEGVPS